MLAARSRALFSVSRRATAPQARSFAYTPTTKDAYQERIDALKSSGEVLEGWSSPVCGPEAKDPEALLRRGEDFFALGIISCYMGALRATAHKMGKTLGPVGIQTSVCLGIAEDADEPGITVTIEVEGVDDEELIMASHQASPYYRALDRVEWHMYKDKDKA